MSRDAINRRDFVRTTAGAGLAAVAPLSLGASPADRRAPEVMIRGAVRPLVIADASGIQFKNGGPESAVERAYRLITEGKDVLDALIAGVNIPELDPTETGIGYGALPNADGVRSRVGESAVSMPIDGPYGAPRARRRVRPQTTLARRKSTVRDHASVASASL